jgi:hypothetical protein
VIGDFPLIEMYFMETMFGILESEKEFYEKRYFPTTCFSKIEGFPASVCLLSKQVLSVEQLLKYIWLYWHKKKNTFEARNHSIIIVAGELVISKVSGGKFL